MRRQSVNHIPGIHDNGPRDHGVWRLTLTAYCEVFQRKLLAISSIQGRVTLYFHFSIFNHFQSLVIMIVPNFLFNSIKHIFKKSYFLQRAGGNSRDMFRQRNGRLTWWGLQVTELCVIFLLSWQTRRLLTNYTFLNNRHSSNNASVLISTIHVTVFVLEFWSNNT